MTIGGRLRVRATVLVLLMVTLGRVATAQEHSVAAVDLDAKLGHALDVALSPWGVTIVDIHPEPPGATMPMAVDRARAVANDARADVVVWISLASGGYAVWIYDVASDHASARELGSAPPFDDVTAAAVALSLKTLLRATVVAPPRERFGAVLEEGGWVIGVNAGAVARIGTAPPLEGRFGVHASVWPAYWKHLWGLSLEASTGLGVPVEASAFTGELRDNAVGLALGARLRLSALLSLEPSLGGAVHLLTLDGLIPATGSHASVLRVDAAAQPRVGITATLFRGWLCITPWMGLTLLTRWQHFLVNGSPVLEIGPVQLEGALRAALALP